MPPLEQLGFDLVGYGCTTCIGNSGPLDAPVAEAVEDNDLVVAAVLSGNRNFEGRIHPLVRASYLASPPLVVAFALAGRVDIDLTTEPLGTGRDGQPGLSWRTSGPPPTRSGRPSAQAVSPGAVPAHVRRACSRATTAGARCPCPTGDRYAWDEASTYIARPPFFEGLTARAGARQPTSAGARVLAVLGDSVTTDHISPAGIIPAWSPAGQWLQARGVTPRRLQQLRRAPRPPRGHDARHLRQHPPAQRAWRSKEGPYTTHQPDGEELFIYDAADALPGGRHAAGDPGRQGVRQRQLARLGGQGHPAAGRARRASPRATSASTAPTWWAWACCRCSSCPARAPPAWA